MNYYEYLGLDPGEQDQDKIKKAIKTKSKECHPDRAKQNGMSEDKATIEQVKINKIKAILQDPIKKNQYDQSGYNEHSENGLTVHSALRMVFDKVLMRENISKNSFIESARNAFKDCCKSNKRLIDEIKSHKAIILSIVESYADDDEEVSLSIKESYLSLLNRMDSDLSKAEYEKTIITQAFELFNKKFVQKEEFDPYKVYNEHDIHNILKRGAL
jgi:DnaJ-class molecular chaperone